MSLSGLMDPPMAKDEKAKGRFEFKAPQSWIDRATVVAASIGLSLSAYIRLVVTEDMNRREGKNKAHDE